MIYKTTKRLILVLIAGGALSFACQPVDQQRSAVPPPLADTLMTVFADMTGIITGDLSEDFFDYIHPDESRTLHQIARQHGYSSLRAYLQNQLRGWPNPDTLRYSGIISNGTYARLALAGNGSSFGSSNRQVRYTFLLFKRSDQQWKLAAMAALEKEAQDVYGNAITYHETDLPTKLRFPRLL